jgi:hypothetical protein
MDTNLKITHFVIKENLVGRIYVRYPTYMLRKLVENDFKNNLFCNRGRRIYVRYPTYILSLLSLLFHVRV